jgi:hypothetical protein
MKRAEGTSGRVEVETPKLTYIWTLRLAKQDFVDGKKAAIAVAGSRELGGNQVGGAGDEGLRGKCMDDQKFGMCNTYRPPNCTCIVHMNKIYVLVFPY